MTWYSESQDRQKRRPAVMADVAQAGRGLVPDGLARPPRQPPCARGHARSGAGGDPPARLPPQLDGAGPGDGTFQNTRGGQLRHHAVRPGFHVVRHRAGRTRCRIRGERHEPPLAQPRHRTRRHPAAAGPGRGRRGGHRAAPGGRGRASARQAGLRRSGGGSGTERVDSRRQPSTRLRAPRPPHDTS